MEGNKRVWLIAGFASVGAGIFYGFIGAVVGHRFLGYDDKAFFWVMVAITAIFGAGMSPYMFRHFKSRTDLRR